MTDLFRVGHIIAAALIGYTGDVSHSSTPRMSSVAVWTVTVLAAAGVALPQSEWTTVTVDLVWGEGGWRVDAVDDRPGPTPMPGPGDERWDPDRFDAELAGFTRLGGEEGA